MSDYWVRTLSDACWWSLVALMFYRAGWRDGRNAFAKEYQKTLAESFQHGSETFGFREAAARSEFERVQWAMARGLAARIAEKFRRPA